MGNDPSFFARFFRFILEGREREGERKRKKLMESCGCQMARDLDRKFGKSITRISSAYNSFLFFFFFFLVRPVSDYFIIPRFLWNCREPSVITNIPFLLFLLLCNAIVFFAILRNE